MNTSFTATTLVLVTLVITFYALYEKDAPSDIDTESNALSMDDSKQLRESPIHSSDEAPEISTGQASITDNRKAKSDHNLGNLDKTYQAALILAQSYDRIDTLPNSEKILLLRDYADLLMQIGSNEEAVEVLEKLLGIPNLDSESELYALRALGETLIAQEQWSAAEDRLKSYLELSTTRDSDLLYDLSYTYYKRELWSEAIPPAIEHINLLMIEEKEVSREQLMYLTSLAYSAEDYESAAWATQVMINEFNEIRDWRNLLNIYSALGDETRQDQVFRDAKEAGLLDELNSIIGPNFRREPGDV